MDNPMQTGLSLLSARLDLFLVGHDDRMLALDYLLRRGALRQFQGANLAAGSRHGLGHGNLNESRGRYHRGAGATPEHQQEGAGEGSRT